ncbi:retrotransposon protein, putative, unclassified [Tanacetum coccineum]
MEELLRIPIVGIENAIVIPVVLADEFELKTELLDFVSNNPFFGLENDDPHSHIRRFYQITRTLRLNQVPDDVVKLIIFLFSLKGAAETWLENEPPCSITTWDDLVSKLLNRFYPHSKTREPIKEITNFQQVFDETFTEAWERFKDLLRKCPHHGFSLLYQIDFFYNGLSQSDQDFLNSSSVLSSGGISNQNDAITALTKQVEAIISSMQEAYNRNQEALIQLMQNQMGQMAEDLQESPLGVLPSNTVTDPLGLTLDGSFTPHSNFLVYQEEEQEPKTITEVVKISSSKSTPLVPPPETLPLIDIVDSWCDKFPIKNNSMSGNPTPSDSVVESPSPSPILYEDSDSLLEETDTLLSHFNNASPEYETFSFDIEKKSSGSTTTHSDHSPPDYEAFYFDEYHINGKSSSSTTTHSDFSLPEYDSFIFDLSIDLFPPADKSVSHHKEFTDELTHIISPPEYDRFYFDLEIVLGEFTRVLEENIFDLSTKILTINGLNDSSLLLSDCDSSLSKEFPEIDLLVSFPFGNEDMIFDPRIFIIKRVQSKRF